ncbi:SDR family oxidoreductase [Actinoplanes sp. Pm04-4]|uniref:SDR family oxidoreductase n=1 Tax=Paractinoplanes pyxinae TaxID=2997416 RepID=A0ABT4AQP2_9ACTN|nr:SDR family oxidoreductase [Actinoplanes pyxinae]MCY1136569.1 SDR family oxidoreductase [Actinoplanes pyxinae]
MTTWFITGTASGFGRSVTRQLLERGDTVAATLRRPERLDDLKAAHGDRLWVRDLDVTDTPRLRSVVDEAFAELGRIDVVLSNAGYGIFGTAEELTDDHIDEVLAVNLIAGIQLTRAAVPHLRAQGGGRLLQVTSQGGQLAYPGFSIYHAAKWGLEGFYEAVAAEVEPFGIEVTMMEPGMSDIAGTPAAPAAEQHPACRDNPAVLRPADVPPEDDQRPGEGRGGHHRARRAPEASAAPGPGFRRVRQHPHRPGRPLGHFGRRPRGRVQHRQTGSRIRCAERFDRVAGTQFLLGRAGTARDHPGEWT